MPSNVRPFFAGPDLDRFTEKAQHVIAASEDEAKSLNQDHVFSEHVLAPIIRDGRNGAMRVLDALNSPVDKLCDLFNASVRSGKGYPVGCALPWASDMQLTLDLAERAAYRLEHDHVGTEHILLGLIEERRGLASKLLAQVGVTYQDAEKAVVEHLARAVAC